MTVIPPKIDIGIRYFDQRGLLSGKVERSLVACDFHRSGKWSTTKVICWFVIWGRSISFQYHWLKNQRTPTEMHFMMRLLCHIVCGLALTFVGQTVHSIHDINPNGFVWDFDGSEWGPIKHQASNSVIRMSSQTCMTETLHLFIPSWIIQYTDVNSQYIQSRICTM